MAIGGQTLPGDISVVTAPEWHIITCEYPPQVGGVGDYTQLVAKGLVEEGERVHVWCPQSSSSQVSDHGVIVHRELGQVDIRDLKRVNRRLNEFPRPRRLLVQWVPHGYGYRSMNLPFCLWLWHRARILQDEIDLMVHEPFLAFGEGTWKQDAAAAIHRIMAITVLHAAKRVWISIPAWEDRLRPFLLGRHVPMKWLPVPSNVQCGEVSTSTSPHDWIMLGHFGTFGSPITGMLESLVPALLQAHAERYFVLMGRGSVEFRARLIAENPGLDNQIHATSAITSSELSSWIRKCDLMIQPYPDGISTRRGSAMAGVSHGKPIVTTVGSLTEQIWVQSEAVALVSPYDVGSFVNAVDHLLADEKARTQMCRKARQLYVARFDVRHTVMALRSGEPQSTLCESLS